MKFTYTNPSQVKKSGSFIKSVKGFSLVELLVVIAVIGTIAAIAIPMISGVTGQAGAAKDLRNGQSVASTFASARAAGYVPPASVTTTNLAIDAMVEGYTPEDGPFKGTSFKVPMGDADVESLKEANAKADTGGFLTYDPTAKTLVYIGK